MILYKDKDFCTGCTACENVCPKNSITMIEDEEGFYYPVIDDKICNDCGLCKKTCPQYKEYNKCENIPEIYAASHNSKDIVFNSSSGGMFTALSDWILENNGVVYGVMFDDNFIVSHNRATDSQTRDKFHGSKYVQSNISSTFKQVEEDLKNNIIVMFTGTPCQNAGLLNYLEKRKVNIDKLYTCDNICHAVTSPLIWKEYVEFIENKFDDKLVKYSMRNKKEGWKSQKVLAEFKQCDYSKECNSKYSFNKLFLSLLPVRPSCYECKYTSFNRVTDITLADFWNFEENNKIFDKDKGISLVLVNSEKGNKWFEAIKSNIRFVLSNQKECWQPHLEYSSAKPKNRIKFWNEYHRYGGNFIIRKYSGGTFSSNAKRILTPYLRMFGLYTLAGKVYAIVFGKKK
ncbi:coenzyme F420 hydrogenase/dehydrogenase beta subunit [Mobilisporobacter senegalensis]|uniref:Coenzyme F420 hydrogenase/dehydrogenase beta subunit n=1 Tax=Mobilisporobacter senegalensis TaxID=1329262 RepID=A0A3N1XXY8_9FIRM|nr:Coenzyme F420 hydrogenase/dehydrogenase, beta subunit C-terminal domain [Mobilisporobacter senegalensis]ROR31465.1 coenzyme F420 hydrogenase/dehydrogenase beta subunit [Mobilisporobacter senegalensis]